MEGRRGERKSGQGGRSDIWEEEGMSGEKRREKRQVILADFSCMNEYFISILLPKAQGSLVTDYPRTLT